VLGSGVRDPDVRNGLEPGGTKGRILNVEVPTESLAEFSHSYYRGRKKNSLLAVGQLVRLRKRNKSYGLGTKPLGTGEGKRDEWLRHSERQTLETFGMGL
jgi:hypothetical protein